MNEEVSTSIRLATRKVIVYCDSQSATRVSKNSTFHLRSKHIDFRYHWIRDMLENKKLHLEKVHTSNNGSYMLTKVFLKNQLDAYRQRAVLVEPLM